MSQITDFKNAEMSNPLFAPATAGDEEELPLWLLFEFCLVSSPRMIRGPSATERVFAKSPTKDRVWSSRCLAMKAIDTR